MTRKPLFTASFTASALGAMFGTFALTDPAHAEIVWCNAFRCEENPGGVYPNGAVCWVTRTLTKYVDVAVLRSCVEAATGKPAVSMHVRAQGASGRNQTTWNGGLAVTQFEFGAEPLFPESGGILYFKVGRQPPAIKNSDGWLLDRPNNASFVATTPEPTVDSVIVLAGGGGSKGRLRTRDGTTGTWAVKSAPGGRGGWAFGQSTSGLCTTGNQAAVCDTGLSGGNNGSAGGGDGGGDLKGGAGGSYKSDPNIPSEGGWGEFHGPAAYGAFDDKGIYLMVGGEGGQGDGGGGGGGTHYKCPLATCGTDEVQAAAGGGGGSRAVRTSIQQTLPVFAEEDRVEFVFNHSSP